MAQPAIIVENLSKQYRIGAHENGKNFREMITDLVAAPFRRIKSFGQSSHREEDSIWALKDVSFEVQPGEVLGIIGRNGAGKSTLLKILSRITEPTEGRAIINGRVASLLEVGTGFHQELTGRENVYLSGAILGMSKREMDSKFDEIVDFSGVEKFIDTPVKRYSSGMRVRLGFAVAAHLEPDILIVDEVLAVGDAVFQKKCLGKMRDVARGKGRTVLFVSHNMGAVRELCQRGLWLNDGLLQADEATEKVVQQYVSTTIGHIACCFNVTDNKRDADIGTKLRITGVRFNGGREVKHGEPLEVEIEYETCAELSGVSFAVGFCTLEGVRVLTIDSDVAGTLKELAPDHKGVCRLVLDQLLLHPTQYLVDVGSRSWTQALDLLKGDIRIDVLPGPNTPNVLLAWTTGGVRFPGKWVIT